MSKTLGLIDHVTPASKTRKRRQHWSTREQVLTYLHRRDLFKSFDEQCLEDYVDYGMEKTERGYSLRFDPQVEYQIYRTIPHLSYSFEGQLNKPTVLIYGDQSHLIRPPELRYMRKRYGIPGIKIEGTHMFPLEHPEECAKMVKDVIKELLG